MTLRDEHRRLSLRIVRRMVKKGVVGSKHHQPQTIAGWFATHERGDVKQTVDAMVAARDVPVRQKARGTVQLSDLEAGKQYLEEHGEEPPERW